jgi:hypothetical protein
MDKKEDTKQILIIESIFSTYFVFLFSSMREKSNVFKIGGETGGSVLQDSNVGLAVSLSSTLHES